MCNYIYSSYTNSYAKATRVCARDKKATIVWRSVVHSRSHCGLCRAKAHSAHDRALPPSQSNAEREFTHRSKHAHDVTAHTRTAVHSSGHISTSRQGGLVHALLRRARAGQNERAVCPPCAHHGLPPNPHTDLHYPGCVCTQVATRLPPRTQSCMRLGHLVRVGVLIACDAWSSHTGRAVCMGGRV